MTDQPLDLEPEDLLPGEAQLEPGEQRARINPEMLESAQPEDLLADVQDDMSAHEGVLRARSRIYPNLPPQSGAMPS